MNWVNATEVIYGLWGVSTLIIGYKLRNIKKALKALKDSYQFDGHVSVDWRAEAKPMYDKTIIPALTAAKARRSDRLDKLQKKLNNDKEYQALVERVKKEGELENQKINGAYAEEFKDENDE